MKITNKTFSKIIYSTIIFLMAHFNMNAQKIEHSEIDAFFSELNATSPGASVVVTKDGKVVYENGFGSANLEYNASITKNTAFHVASLSKQFTVFAILLLERDGKLSLDDDVHKYLPDLPDFGAKITLRNLANHTSGLRDQWDLLAMSGIRLDDVITQNHVLKLINNQKELNFTPGERNLYCNTGFTLLAEVVKKVSGKSFFDFTREQIFEPLGMDNTQFYDDHHKIVPNRAYSYKEKDGQFVKSILSYATVGPTSLLTTAKDFGAWAMNFENPIIGDIEIINKMNEPTTLNNTENTGFAFGQFIGNYKGLPNFYHTGSDAGYRSYFIRIPKHKLSVAVFSNLSTFNAPGEALKIVDYILKDELSVDNPSQEKNENIKYDPSIFTKLPVEELKKFTGIYWANKYSIKNEILLKNDTLFYYISENEMRAILPISKNKFKVIGDSDDIEVNFSKNQNGERIMMLLINGNKVADFEALAEINLKDYSGSYFSNELQTFYKLTVIEDQLIIMHHRMDDITLNPVHKNIFMSDTYFLQKLEFVRDENGDITGFKSSNGRVKNLWFEKDKNNH